MIASVLNITTRFNSASLLLLIHIYTLFLSGPVPAHNLNSLKCDAVVILRSSTLGTQFVSHAGDIFATYSEV